MGYTQTSVIVTDYNQNNRIAFLKSCDSSQVLELIEPINEKSSIYHFKEGYHHICYEVNNLDTDTFIQNFKKMKIGKIFTKPIQAVAIQNRTVVFAYLTSGVFVEFLL